MQNKKLSKNIPNADLFFWACTLLGVLFIAAQILVSALTSIPKEIFGIALILVYIVITSSIYARNRHRFAEQPQKKESDSMNTVMTDMIQKINIPVTITDEYGKIIWYNNEFSIISGRPGTLFGANLNEFCPVSLPEIIFATKENRIIYYDETQRISQEYASENMSGYVIPIDKSIFLAKTYDMTIAKRAYYITVLNNVSEFFALQTKMEKENTVVAYIVLDNLEELAQYVRVSYRSAANEIENMLKNWAASLDALIQEYDHDKYLMVFTQEQLQKCIDNKFEILDKIRSTNLGDSSMPVTVSMGISYSGENMSEREKNASAALDMALQRGGDQIAIKTDEGMDFFGGKSKGVQKRTKVRARVIANQLTSLIEKSGNVLIMGHFNPDFDSIGACIGIARLAMFCEIDAKIIIDKKSESFRLSTAPLKDFEEYKNMFIDGVEGLDLIRTDTLLILVDANNFNIFESPEIAKNAYNIVVIDHHRKAAENDYELLLSYIDPSASSTCELVTEIIEQVLPSGVMLKEEANIMLSGIMVDTKNFTKTTGTRTFSAALYLRSEGASSEAARTFFNENFNDYIAEAKFGSSVTIYRDRIAITTSDGAPDADNRTAASKVADKLLGVKHVDASFALVIANDNTIHISARSNGSINVQLILEDLHGGGHFDSAGAQLSNSSMKDALILLKEAIDKYLDNK